MGTNEENIIQNFICFTLHRLRLRPKSTGSDQLRLHNTDHMFVHMLSHSAYNYFFKTTVDNVR